jgi:hypothetical protein
VQKAKVALLAAMGDDDGETLRETESRAGSTFEDRAKAATDLGVVVALAKFQAAVNELWIYAHSFEFPAKLVGEWKRSHRKLVSDAGDLVSDDDLYSEALLAIRHAIVRFQPTMPRRDGVSLLFVYARPVVQQALLSYAQKLASPGSIPRRDAKNHNPAGAFGSRVDLQTLDGNNTEE